MRGPKILIPVEYLHALFLSFCQEYQEFPQADLGSALNTFNVSYYYDDDEDEPEPTATAAPAPVEDTDEEIVDGGSEDPSIAGDEAA